MPAFAGDAVTPARIRVESRPMRNLGGAIAILATVACGGGGGSKLDAAHLPAEALGLVPGAATEAAAIAAIPGAKVDRDRRLGGDKDVELSEQPALAVRSPDEKTEAWLVKLGGELRLASLRVPLARDCAAVAAAFGDHATNGYCGFSNRRLDPGERQLCAESPDGRKIWITCHDRRSLSFWLEVSPNASRSYMIREPD
jgi:hypothetical protein